MSETASDQARRRPGIVTQALLGLKREPPAVYRGEFDPRVLYKAFMALHDFHS
jgi:oleate hydratase